MKVPDDLFDEIVGDPDDGVREAFASNAGAPVAQRARLVRDRCEAVRAWLARCESAFPAERKALPSAAYDVLARDPVFAIRRDLILNPDVSASALEILSGDRDPRIRRGVCVQWWDIPDEWITRFLGDTDADVRHLARRRLWPRDLSLIPEVVAEEDEWDLGHALEEAPMTRESALRWVTDERAWIRAAVATNPALPADLAAELARDTSPRVRLAVSTREELTEAQRADIDYTVGRRDRVPEPAWVLRGHADPVVLRRCATSGHPVLRRSVARSPHLPTDLVELLTADPDFVVRLLVCESHAQVPADVLRETFREAEGMARQELTRHPNFPRERLADPAESRDPTTRRNAGRDRPPAPDLPVGLAADDVIEAALKALCSPETPPAVVVAHPSGPSWRFAVVNPALPVAEMWRIVAQECPAASP